jgi:hypothetical protein
LPVRHTEFRSAEQAVPFAAEAQPAAGQEPEAPAGPLREPVAVAVAVEAAVEFARAEPTTLRVRLSKRIDGGGNTKISS